jgi:hypothetical protein
MHRRGPFLIRLSRVPTTRGRLYVHFVYDSHIPRTEVVLAQAPTDVCRGNWIGLLHSVREITEVDSGQILASQSVAKRPNAPWFVADITKLS